MYIIVLLFINIILMSEIAVSTIQRATIEAYLDKRVVIISPFVSDSDRGEVPSPRHGMCFASSVI